jgi:hypothetical protein
VDITAFQASLTSSVPPEQLSHALQALWYDAKGDWETAHNHAQAQEDSIGSWVHGYWYRRAGKPTSNETLESEWETIVKALLS